MTPQEFLDEFGTLAESADGVPKLRELILELAVRGKLVEQDEGDEPANVLLDRLKKEKDRLVEEKSLPKPVRVDDLNGDEPYPVPSSWQWERLGNISHFIEAGWSPRCESHPRAGDDWGVLKISAVTWGTFNPDENKALPANLEPRPQCEVEAGDFVMSRANTSELVAKSVVVCDTPPHLMLNDKLLRVKFPDSINPRFISLYNNGPTARTYYISVASGTSVSMRNVSRANVTSLAVPVPPLAEQHRIVSKVDELMGLCDRLEAVQGERRGVRVRLNRSSLDRLTSVSGVGARQRGSELSAAWQRVCDHFEVLYDTPETLPDLRQTILQLAVQGKLVPQDPNDEPAEVVVGDVVDFLGGYAFKSEWFQKRPGIRLVRNQNIGHGELDWSDTEYLPEDRAEEFAKFELHAGDLVLSLNRPFISTGLKLAWIRESDCPCLLVQRIACMRPDSDRLLADYLFLWCNSPHFYRDAHVVPSSGVPYIATNRVAKMDMLLPPLSEQKRIVSKVTHLLSQVTRLGSTLTRRESTRTQLLTASIHSILDSSERP